MPIKLICNRCSKEYLVRPYLAKNSKYCSQKCYGISERGRIPKSAFKKGQHISSATEFKSGSAHIYFGKSSPALGKHWKLTANTRRNMSKAQKGKLGMVDELHPGWKGDNVGYFGLHLWIRRKLGFFPEKCSHCGIYGKKTGRNWNIHWANKSGNYLRDFNDWIPLCVKCHKKYDSISKSSLSI